MLQETGTIVRIEADALWVETLQKTACQSCSAQKGCGQNTLAKALSSSTVIRVLLDGQSAKKFQLDQQVVIGIPDDVVVKGSLLIYLLPLIMLIVFASAGFHLVPSDGVAAIGAVLGLIAGGLLVRWRSETTRHDPRLQPVLLDC